jgi:hypothetical protein
MSVTAHLTTDVAAVPLLWAVPLALYLITFILVFARWPARLHRLVGRVTPMALCALAVALLTRATEPPVAVAAVHLGVFVLVCLLCHGEFARDRPTADRLTEFYLWVSVGGVLGGMFNALTAPVLFAHLGPVEYPLAIVLAGLVRPNGTEGDRRPRWDDFAFPIFLGAIAAALVVLTPTVLGEPPTGDAGAELLDRLIRAGITFGLPAAAAFALVWRPIRFSLALAAVFLAGSLDRGRGGETLAVTRDFFGTLRVTRNGDGFIRLWHGTTQHGMQQDGDREHPAPLMYYHRKGPLGRYFAAIDTARLTRVGVVGLGCGATAAYAEPNQNWTFFEIDPGVVRVANDERFFTYLSTCRAGRPAVVLGDARRQLVKAPDGGFDLLVLDAFSSDAIPVHLLTGEAFRLYLAKLGPRGVLAFHLSNRYLDLPPLVARLAAETDPSLVVVLDTDLVGERESGRSPSIWVFVAHRRDDLGEKRFGLSPVTPLRGPGWTDDWSNLLGVWKKGDE